MSHNFPSHTQAVERAIKMVTEASAKVSDSQRRDGLIRTRQVARDNQSNFETKKDF